MPIAKQNTQFYAAYNELKRRILLGHFTSEDRLREVEVAKMLGMGRTPVREALKRLEDERLLTHEPRRGLVVTQFDQKGITQLYEMREVLEGAAAEFAARHATDAEIDHMDAILDDCEKEDADHVALNLDFHQAIYGAAHNDYLIRTLQSVTETTYLLGRSTLQSPERARKALLEHREIAAAIRRRDANAAGTAAKHHIRQALVERLKLFRKSGSH
jgi:DNA-binding GntR family transcriptional regulator